MEERACEDHFKATYSRNTDGRFVVKLPIKIGGENRLGDSRSLAIKRFYMLERKLAKQPNLKEQYTSFMQEYIQLGHMQVAPTECTSVNNSPPFYLPHPSVLKQSSLTTKLRLVFDGSAKSTTNVCLNDILMVGPTLQQDLLSIILRFRTYRFVVTADINKMYRQVLIDASQRQLQRIVWCENSDEELKTYELSTVTYGTASASFLAIRSLQQLAVEEKHKHPIGSKVTLTDFYVDDLLTGADTLHQAEVIINETKNMFSQGGFQLQRWMSNCPELLRNTISDNIEHAILDLDNDCSIKTLGLQWNSYKYTLQFSVPAYASTTRITKRTREDLNTPLSKTYYWSESTIALTWITTTANSCKTFVANRVGEIQDLTYTTHGHHVSTNDNSVDVFSRGQSVEELIHNDSWWRGSEWLSRKIKFRSVAPSVLPLVKSVRYHLRRVVGNASLTFEEMYTMLIQIESVLNSRPLVPVSNDPNELSFLTPGHFLIGGSPTSTAEPDVIRIPINRLSRSQHIVQFRQHLWSRWSKEYLNQLQQRGKWKKKKNSHTHLRPGQLVILQDDNNPPMRRLLGRVESVHPGRDGIVRAATVRTAGEQQ